MIRFMLCLQLFILFSIGGRLVASPTELSPHDELLLENLLLQMEGDPSVRGQAERAYYKLVNDYIMKGLDTLYNSPNIKMTFADFTEESSRGSDGGTGLHVIKRFDDGPLTILVNEHWPLEPSERAISLPNELRVRMRLLRRTPEHKRGEPGSHRDYLSARYRIAWNYPASASLYIEPRYSESGERLRRRKSLLPSTCESCHHESNPFRKKFALGASEVDFEVNVQAHHFDKRFLKDTFGIKKLQRALGTTNPIIDKLLTASKNLMTFPGQAHLFAEYIGKIPEFLPGDQEFSPTFFPTGKGATELGSYGVRQPGNLQKKYYIEAVHHLEIAEFGRYNTWVNLQGSICK